MNTGPARRRARLAIVATAALATATALAVPSATAAGGAKWTEISSGNINITVETPSIAKFGSTYETVWTAKVGAKYQLQARILNAAGKPLGSVINVLATTWTEITGDPTIFALGSTRYIAFNGDEGATGTYSLGMEDYATSTDGTHWTLGKGSMSNTELAAQAAGVAVIPNGGTPITAMALGNPGVIYHLGIDPNHRPASAPDVDAAHMAFTDFTGLGRDAKSGAVWALWASGDSGHHKDGVWAQQILPGPQGTPLHAPGSYAGGGTTSYGPEQDVSAAARAGGGVYTAYVTSANKSVDVWKLGAKSPFATFKDGQGPSDVIVTPGPGGRIWVYWRDGSAWHAARSNKAATRFGPTSTIGTPKNDFSNLEIAGVGSAGPLEAIGLLTTAKNVNEVVEHQFLPRLTITLSSASVKRGHSFTVQVTDAGDPVKGATVHFGSTKKKTNSKGKVTFKVPNSTSPGKHSVTLTMSGYAAGSATVTVKS